MAEQVDDYGKEIFRAGNWILTNVCIYKKNTIYNQINIERLWEFETDNDECIYFWPKHLVLKNWAVEDIFHFNTVFFYALDFFKEKKPSNAKPVIIWKTLLIQKNELEFRETKLDLNK